MNSKLTTIKAKIIVISLFLIVNFQCWGQEDIIGINSTEFYREKKEILNSLQDLLSHYDKSEMDYENDLGKICFENFEDLATQRIAFKDTQKLSFVRFLGDIAGIELYMGSHRFELYYAPSLESCRELYEFYLNNPQNINLFTYWIIYNQCPYFEITYCVELTQEEQLEFMFAEDDGQTEEFFKKHPSNTLYKNYLILKALREQCGLLYDILKSEPK